MQLLYNPGIALLGIYPREITFIFTQKPIHNKKTAVHNSFIVTAKNQKKKTDIFQSVNG